MLMILPVQPARVWIIASLKSIEDCSDGLFFRGYRSEQSHFWISLANGIRAFDMKKCVPRSVFSRRRRFLNQAPGAPFYVREVSRFPRQMTQQPNEMRLRCAAVSCLSQMQFYYDGRRQLQPLVRRR